KPGALAGSPGLRATILLGNAVVLTPPVGPKLTGVVLMVVVTLKVTPARDGFGGGLVTLLPSGPNSKNSFVVVLALFGPATLISMASVAVPKAVIVCRSTVPDG